MALIAYNMFNIFSSLLDGLLTDSLFEEGDQYIYIINSNTFLYSISLCPFPALFRLTSFQQSAMILAICSYMEEALHQVKYQKAPFTTMLDTTFL